MSIRYCNIPFCANFHGVMDPNIRLFRLPKDSKLEDKWMEIIRANVPEEHQTISPIALKLCSLHFDMDNMKRKCRLDPGAIPTIFPLLNTIRTIEPKLQIPQTYRSTIQPMVGGRLPTEFCGNCPLEELQKQELHNQLDQINETIKQKQLTVTRLKNELDTLRNRRQTFEAVTQCTVCNKQFNPEELSKHRCVQKWKRLFCAYCPLSFTSTPYLLQHLKMSHPQPSKSVRCHECAITFGMQLLYDIHLKAYHTLQKRSGLNCTQCHIKLRDRATKKLHCYLYHRREYKHQCYVCSMHVKTLDELRLHMDKRHVTGRRCKTIGCRPCGIQLRDQASKYIHTNLYHRRAHKFQCYVCGNHSEALDALRRHMNKMHVCTNKCSICHLPICNSEIATHSCITPEKLSCEQCSASFGTLHAFNDHLQNDHVGKRQYKCEVCKCIFAARILLDKHSKVHVNSTFTCDICSNKYATKRGLFLHISSVHIKKAAPEFLCHLCGITKHTATFLRNHLQTHEAPQHKCPKCGRVFQLQGTLRNHMARHVDPSSAQSYQCNICNKIFSAKVKLRTHVNNTHKRTEKDRKFACKLCSMKFFIRFDMQHHLKTVHTTDRAHRCTHCDKAYKHPGDLNKHLRTHLGENMYKCSQCPEDFRLPWQLENHLLKHEEERYKASDCS